MDSTDAAVTEHYTIDDLLDTILNAVGVTDRTDSGITPERIETVDEFHVGGAAATERLLSGMGISAGAAVLDIGSGVGGPARYTAIHTGANVTGIDLTDSYVQLARELSRMTGQSGTTSFLTASALNLPFGDESFDAAMLLHVGMNIADKARLMSEVGRVLRPGGKFGVYDIMTTGPGMPSYPLPWAATSETSFPEQPQTYRMLAEAAGFAVLDEVSRRSEALAFFAQMRAGNEARKAEALPPLPGIGLLMGQDAPSKLANMVAAIAAGDLTPTEIILGKRVA